MRHKQQFPLGESCDVARTIEKETDGFPVFGATQEMMVLSIATSHSDNCLIGIYPTASLLTEISIIPCSLGQFIIPSGT